MLQPAEFLDAARLLVSSSSSYPSDARIRRAISTAYYSIFHSCLTCAAERFVGPANASQPAYALIYRGFNHAQMKRLCEEVDRSPMKTKLAEQLKKPDVHAELRAFATNFVLLQQLRHMADYDPQVSLLVSDAEDAILAADEGIKALLRAPEDDRTDFLALLLTNLRS